MRFISYFILALCSDYILKTIWPLFLTVDQKHNHCKVSWYLLFQCHVYHGEKTFLVKNSKTGNGLNGLKRFSSAINAFSVHCLLKAQ